MVFLRKAFGLDMNQAGAKVQCCVHRLRTICRVFVVMFHKALDQKFQRGPQQGRGNQNSKDAPAQPECQTETEKEQPDGQPVDTGQFWPPERQGAKCQAVNLCKQHMQRKPDREVENDPHNRRRD